MRRLLTDARFEILPTATIEEKVRQALPSTTTITVTASPAKPLEATLGATERLTAAGYRVIPHLAARMIHGRSELSEIVARLQGNGVTAIFVPGGDATPQDGCYHSAVSCSMTWRASRIRSPRSGSPAIPSRIQASRTMSPSRRCGTSGAMPLTSSPT